MVIPKNCKFSIWAWFVKASSSHTFESVHKSWPSWLAQLGIRVTQSTAAITKVNKLGSHTEMCLPGSLLRDCSGPAKHSLVFAGFAWNYIEAIPGSWQRHAGTWDVPPHSITCFFTLWRTWFFHLRMQQKQSATSDWLIEAALPECQMAEASAQISSSPLLPIVCLTLYQSPFFAPASYPLLTHFWYPDISIYSFMGSKDNVG